MFYIATILLYKNNKKNNNEKNLRFNDAFIS